MPTSSSATYSSRAATVFVQMVERFGSAIVRADGTLDRAAVAEIVFSDKEQLAALNAIVHPAVTDEMTRRRQALAPTDATVVLDIPLLIETNYSDLDAVVVVDVDPEIAIQRLVAASGLLRERRSRTRRQSSVACRSPGDRRLRHRQQWLPRRGPRARRGLLAVDLLAASPRAERRTRRAHSHTAPVLTCP